MVTAAECLKRRGREGGVVDRREAVGLQPAREPAGGDAGVAVRLLERDEGCQLEEVAEGRARNLRTERRLREGDVAPLECPLEDRPW